MIVKTDDKDTGTKERQLDHLLLSTQSCHSPNHVFVKIKCGVYKKWARVTSCPNRSLYENERDIIGKQLLSYTMKNCREVFLILLPDSRTIQLSK